jgi:hypothetical protein
MILDEQLRAFLEQRLIARMTTIGPNGYPHSVPIWYMLDGDDLIMATGPESRKVQHIRANPKGAVVIGGDPKGDHRAYHVGYLFQGDFSLEGEPGFEGITRIAHRYRDDEEQTERDIAEWGPHQLIRFKIQKISKVME